MKLYCSLRIALILLVLTPMSLLAMDNPNEEHFMLSVRLQDILNHDFVIRKRIELGKPFRAEKTNGRVKNTISGSLRAKADGKYRLRLTISEWVSEKANMRDGWELGLELNKAWSGGPIA